MNNAKQDRARCSKINAIRDAARARLGLGPALRCPTCVRERGAAHCRKDAVGHVFEGCVDAFHAGYHSDPERESVGSPAQRRKRFALRNWP